MYQMENKGVSWRDEPTNLFCSEFQLIVFAPLSLLALSH